MKKAVYRLILFAAITAFVLSLSASVKAEPNDTQTKQNQCIASDTTPLSKADKPEPAPHQKSAGNKENSQLQLAKEQLRGDFYKDSQDNLKSALYTLFAITIAVILSAFGVIAYFIFKDKRDYKDAVEAAKEAARDAKYAANNARDLEKEAQGILADIGKQAKTKLEEIDTKANDKQENIDKLVADKLDEIDAKAQETMDAIKAEAKAGQVEIEKIGNEERQKSLEEAERQRKISDLYNKGWKADKAEDYETAANCYRQIVEDMKEENDPIAYNNWGVALDGLAENKKGKEAEKLYNQAIEKYKKAIEIKPDHHSAYNNWGAALLYLAILKGGKDAEDLLKQAEEVCLKAEPLKTGKGAYNIACVYARRGNEEKCKEWLKVAEKAQTLLPTREHAMADDYFKSVRDKDWFKKLRWKGE
jgi:hypothetical protein